MFLETYTLISIVYLLKYAEAYIDSIVSIKLLNFFRRLSYKFLTSNAQAYSNYTYYQANSSNNINKDLQLEQTV